MLELLKHEKLVQQASDDFVTSYRDDKDQKVTKFGKSQNPIRLENKIGHWELAK